MKGLAIACVSLCLASVLASDASYQPEVSSLRDISKDSGIAPDIRDYFDFVSTQGVHLSFNEQMKLYGELLNMQRPEIPLTKVISLIRAKQNSISDVFCRYTVSKSGFDKISDQNFSLTNTFTYAYDRGRRHFDETLAGNENTSRRSHSYDGEREYVLEYPKGREATPYAAIGNLSTDNWFFPREFPMLQSMLLDTGSSSFPQRSLDLYLMLREPGVYVYQKLTEVDGVKCLLIADMVSRIYLDVERNFCVLMYEEYDIEWGANGNIVGASLTYRRLLSDLKDYGNGLWLPSKIENTFFENGQKVWGETITVLELAINKGIDDTYFTGNFPESTFVFDKERNFSYLQSDSPSINGLLQETVRSKRVWTFQVISLTLGFLLILTWIIIRYRAYLNMKNAG
ncbi:MAG: hypothetical protein FWE95_00215 [Planctomycetaceae bacterium]|nr:hypothetical protein [Planctomycetaceae bacterium]